jgi:diguanylate cyclase (GGDEF)-like protein
LPSFAPFAAQAAGVLALPLTPSYQDYVLWFRGEWVRTIRWGGDPDTPMTGDQHAEPGDAAPVPLGPRQSFAACRQEIRGRCRPWLAAEIDTARALAEAIPDMLLDRARSRLARHAQRDPHSGLPNQERILSQTSDALQRGEPTALLRIDLDHFGQINETLGRRAGDQLIRQAAHRLGTVVGDRGALAHAGGDDFIVLCQVDVADQIADQIVAEFRRRPFLVAAGQIRATTSIGIAVAEPNATADGLLNSAGTAMFRMKYFGRNGAAKYSGNQTANWHP